LNLAIQVLQFGMEFKLHLQKAGFIIANVAALDKKRVVLMQYYWQLL
jgi:hypothetical protein